MKVRLPSFAITSLATFCASSFLASAAPRVSMSPDFQTRTWEGVLWARRPAATITGTKRFIGVAVLCSTALADLLLDEIGALARED